LKAPGSVKARLTRKAEGFVFRMTRGLPDGGSTMGERMKEKRRDREKTISLTVNGRRYELGVGQKTHEVDPSHTLVYTLRETLGLTGTKVGCGRGSCGSCTVLMDGRPILSCLTLTAECDGKSITTIEGLGDPATGRLDPLQQAFIDHGAFQCGFCTPGMIMTAKALLEEKPSPTEEEVREALSGNYCRCMSHYQVVEAVLGAVHRGEDSNV
jgi:carbon-monoxide dehydrogenase small subunit